MVHVLWALVEQYAVKSVRGKISHGPVMFKLRIMASVETLCNFRGVNVLVGAHDVS